MWPAWGVSPRTAPFASTCATSGKSSRTASSWSRNMSDNFREQVALGIPDTLPPLPAEEPGVSHAPPRRLLLSPPKRRLAVQNALRYFPPQLHPALAPEFARELLTEGHIYMRRFRPGYPMHARPIA